MDNRDLFDELCHRLGTRPDRDGEVRVDCPFCGKEAKRGQTHFSFGERGFKCFVCGEGGPLRKLAEHLRMDIGDRPARPRKAPTPKRRPPPKLDFAALLKRYTAAPEADRWAKWRAYKPLPWPVIWFYRLGLGRFPPYSSKCQHERLMLPLITGRNVVGFRGRAAGCSCTGWLSPSGSRKVLYNGDRLGPGSAPMLGVAMGGRTAKGNVLIIAENPVDALLAEYAWGVAAVATLGVSLWRDEWTEAVARCGSAKVVVAFDCDAPGNGGGERGRKKWLETHDKAIVPNGVRLANWLLAAGVNAHLYDWGDAPLGADLGDLLMGRVT